MAEELFLRRGLRGLEPCSAADAETVDGLSGGIDYRCVLTRAAGRSVRQAAMYWSLCKLVSDNYDPGFPMSKDNVSDLLKLRTGHCSPVKMADGTVVLIPSSVSFAKADQDVFNRFFERALLVIARDIIPGLDCDSARREILELINDREAA